MPEPLPEHTASALIDGRIRELGDWRGQTLAHIRQLIRAADPDVVEEWKWRGVPVWSHAGILCTGETYNDVVKLTFAKGAALHDPASLFNASLKGNARRAIDLKEGQLPNETAFKTLIQAAATLNQQTKKTRKPKPTPSPSPHPRSNSHSKLSPTSSSPHTSYLFTSQHLTS